MKLKDLPKHEQPREKLVERGVENLHNQELLAILLRTGIEGKDVLKVASEILTKYPLSKFLALNLNEISAIKGIGRAKATLLLAAFELTKRALEIEDESLPVIQSVRDVVDQLQDIRKQKKEYFVALFLNSRNQLIQKETISIGTINSGVVHPREVFKPAIENLASGVILAHNHPSGSPAPSPKDIEMTSRLVEAGRIMGIEVIDHIIVTIKDSLSFKEKGLIEG